MDRIELRGLRLLGTHGLLPEEHARPQPFEVDIDVELPLAGAGHSDDVADTVDYGALVEMARRIVEGEHHNLLERLAERLAEAVLADPAVRATEVRIRKLRPPVAADLASAGVVVRRTR